ncbi:MAG: dihydroorotase [Bdellovibrionaceae bacterium]|nr:dihydroorotase [Pseudobdellovibrionaceae bacterium]
MTNTLKTPAKQTASADRFDLVLSGGICVLPSPHDPDLFERAEVEIAVRDGRIVAIGTGFVAKADQVFDAKGLHVLPGLIDTQVHFREPGLEHKEDLETGTRGAILGGITGVFEMPNTKPPTTTAEALADKLQRASTKSWSEYAFYVGATPDNATTLTELERQPGCCGVKIFMGSSTGTLLVSEDEHIHRVLQNGRRRVAVHAEDEERLRERRELLGTQPSVSQHPLWRDDETAIRATRRLLALAHKVRRPIHVLHVTTAEEMDLFRKNKDIDVTVEVLPQHLTLSAPDCYERLGTYAQMNPPIRDARHREALWRAVQDGTVTLLGSDHAPHTREEKQKPYPESPSGMTGVQTMVPVMLDHVAQGRLSLERMVELLARNPARAFRIQRKGEIRVGNDADFTVVDLRARRTITDSWIASRCGWTPFDGMTVTGWPCATIIRGQLVMQDDQTLGTPQGQPFAFEL